MTVLSIANEHETVKVTPQRKHITQAAQALCHRASPWGRVNEASPLVKRYRAATALLVRDGAAQGGMCDEIRTLAAELVLDEARKLWMSDNQYAYESGQVCVEFCDWLAAGEFENSVLPF